MEYIYSIYIMASPGNKVLYVGVTNHLSRRIYEHQHHLVAGFTKKYNIVKLVYHEETDDVYSALEREKQLKRWSRKKKDQLIASVNPHWKDLGHSLL